MTDHNPLVYLEHIRQSIAVLREHAQKITKEDLLGRDVSRDGPAVDLKKYFRIVRRVAVRRIRSMIQRVIRRNHGKHDPDVGKTPGGIRGFPGLTAAADIP